MGSLRWTLLKPTKLRKFLSVNFKDLSFSNFVFFVCILRIPEYLFTGVSTTGAMSKPRSWILNLLLMKRKHRKYFFKNALKNIFCNFVLFVFILRITGQLFTGAPETAEIREPRTWILILWMMKSKPRKYFFKNARKNIFYQHV